MLVDNPAASLSDIARAAGISRTTLHKLYTTRDALLVAVADDALKLVSQVYSEARLDVAAADAPDALLRLATGLVPLGPRLMFLSGAVPTQMAFRYRLRGDGAAARQEGENRAGSQDREPEFLERVKAADLDEPVRALERRARADGVFRADLSDGWATSAFNALVYVAWEQIAAGRLAPLAAPGLVVSTLLQGVSASSSPTR